MTPGQQTQGVAFTAQDSARRPIDHSQTLERENEGFFEDVLQKRFGGDASVRNRLIGMYDKNDPLAAADFFNEWSGNTGAVFNPGETARAGSDYYNTQSAEEQAAALEQFNMMRGFI
jgi:hypothetical protein